MRLFNRRFTALAMASLIILSLTGCGRKSNTVSTTEDIQAETDYKVFQWPDSEIARLLPVPESNKGKIEWEASYGFVINVSETTKEQFDAYVKKCRDMGFTVDYRKGDDYYFADNEAGNHISLRYENEDIMFVRIDEPIATESPVATERADTELVETERADATLGWKTETYGGLSFKIDSSWGKELSGDSSIYTAPVTGTTGLILCTRREDPKIADKEIRTEFDSVISDALVSFANSKEISRSYFSIGDKQASRVSCYFEFDNNYTNDINDDERGRLDLLMVHIEDGITALFSVFTTSEYEYSYNNIIETTLNSVELEQQLDESSAETSVFSPQNVSDETIKSIKTYNDYLKMYEMIIIDYFANYEAAIKGTALYSEETFAVLKSTYEDSFQQQKDIYGAMGNTKITGKDDLVKFLIDYRDSLKEYVESLKESIG